MTEVKKNRFRDLLVISGITIFLLILLDSGIRIAFYFYDQRPDYRIEADAYSDPNLARAYFEEHRLADKARWEPYVYWRRKAFSGDLIHVDEQGRRLTWNPSFSLSDTFQNTYMFGGSTLWGTGTPDEFTIPSFLSKKLQKNNISAKVQNWGESGYASTQNLIQLIRLLQRGERPDMVIFYDGVNDVYNAVQRGNAGEPANEYNREREFNLLNEPGRLYGTAASAFLSHGLYRLFRGLFASETTIPEEKITELSVDVIRLYLENVRMVISLAEMYDFEPVFIWQPSIFTKELLTEYEREELARESHARLLMLSAHNQLLKKRENADGLPVYDFTGIFDDMEEPLFIDFCHLAEKGNQLVADEIFKRLFK